MATQLELARQGKTTDVMRRAAERENVNVDHLRQELAAGRSRARSTPTSAAAVCGRRWMAKSKR